MTRPVTIVSQVPSTVNAYGDAKSTSTSATAVGYLEQTAAVEVLVNQETYTSDWLLILPAGTVIDASDQVLVDGATFEVVGPPARPWRPSTGEHHVECRLRQTTG